MTLNIALRVVLRIRTVSLFTPNSLVSYGRVHDTVQDIERAETDIAHK